jgi:hypothetical protein
VQKQSVENTLQCLPGPESLCVEKRSPPMVKPCFFASSPTFTASPGIEAREFWIDLEGSRGKGGGLSNMIHVLRGNVAKNTPAFADMRDRPGVAAHGRGLTDTATGAGPVSKQQARNHCVVAG